MLIHLRIACVCIVMLVMLQFQYNYYFPFFPINNNFPSPTATIDIRLTPVYSDIPGPPPISGTIPFPNAGRTYEDDESEEVKQLAVLLTTYPEQRRTSLTRHSLLARTAKSRCDDMANRNYFGLPEYYSLHRDANNIESIAAGFPSALDAFNALLLSPAHKTHLMGEDGFFAAQNYFGIYYTVNFDTKWHHFYCFIISEIKLQKSGE
jgi:uncharacterized protein YkwD